MAYLVRCRYCNHYYFSVSHKDIEETIIEHICNKHGEQPIVYGIVRISPKLYCDYLRSRDNAKFWQALRRCRKIPS